MLAHGFLRPHLLGRSAAARRQRVHRARERLARTRGDATHATAVRIRCMRRPPTGDVVVVLGEKVPGIVPTDALEAALDVIA